MKARVDWLIRHVKGLGDKGLLAAGVLGLAFCEAKGWTLRQVSGAGRIREVVLMGPAVRCGEPWWMKARWKRIVKARVGWWARCLGW